MKKRHLIFLFVLLIGWLPSYANNASDTTKNFLPKVRDIIIYKDVIYYSSFPSIVKNPDGEFLLSVRRAPDRRVVFGEKGKSHLDPNSYLVSMTTKDGFNLKGEPKLLYAHDFGGSKDFFSLTLKDDRHLGSQTVINGGQEQQPIKVEKVWDMAPHNAFPDLIRFKNYFYATVREGNSHMPDNSGQVRIIRSKDGEAWESIGLLEKDDMDVREARLSVTPEGKIMVLTAVGIYDKGYQELFPMVSFSDKKGLNYSELERTTMDLAPSLDWIWSLTWHKGVGYGVIYQIGIEPWKTYLLKTTDGKRFEKISQIDTGGNPNEATIRFDKNGKMHVLVRREAEDRMGVFASSTFPYTEWVYDKMSIRLGGPNFLFLDENRFVVGSRFHQEGGSKTGIFTTDLKGNIESKIILPSGGDTSYPGMVFHKKKLWVMYYSSHEEKSKIYLAQIPIRQLNP